MPKDLTLPPTFPAYYDHRRGNYLIDSRHGWTQLSKEDLLLHMRSQGYDHNRANGELSLLEVELLKLQIHNKIDFSGSVAGHKKGIVTMGGSRVLVTQGYREIIPVRKPWPLFEQFLVNLFDRIDKAQKPIFYSWCQVYLRSLHANIFMPGQALVLAGPHKCGKSFLQNLLTHLFGGRSANPWPYMSGSTEFNSELCAAEHLQVEDPAVSKLSDRLDFSARIKQLTVNEIQPCHGKNRDIITIQPRFRLSISINDDSYNVRAVPPMDDSTADKFDIFRCAQNSVPCDSNDPEVREKFRLAIIDELAGFAWFLLNEWRIPVELQSGRFGVTHYHQPEILDEINSQSPEFDLLNLFDENPHCFFKDSRTPWTGSTKRLCSKFSDIGLDHEAQKLSKSERTVGLRMASLARKCPTRVHYKRTETSRYWIVYPANYDHSAVE